MFSFKLLENKYVYYVFVLLIAALPLFAHLDEAPIQVWDEMRSAVSAFEMNKSGHFILTMFDSKPEEWSTKPPMLIWTLALSLRFLGYNEMAVRLPIAIAALLTCFLIYGFIKRRTGRAFPGLLAVFVLVTTKGYVAIHGTRTGDYDALLTLFTTATALCLVNFIEEEKRGWLWLSGISLIAAVLTKGVAGLFIVPALVLYIFIRKKWKLVLGSKDLYWSIALFVLIIGGYYFLRNFYQPGYLQLVWQNELGGRYNQVIESHAGDAWTYYNDLNNTSFSWWMPFLIPALLMGIFSKDLRIRNIILFATLNVLSIFLVLSLASTKLPWYLIPIYPFLAIASGLFIFQCLELLWQWKGPEKLWTFNFLPICFLILIGYAPYSAILDSTLGGNYYKPNPALNDAGVYFKNVLSGDHTLNCNVICGDNYPLFWYYSVINRQQSLLFEKNKEELQCGMKVLTWEQGVKDFIQDHYVFNIEENFRSVTIFQILGEKLDGINGIPIKH